jgi:hypothetical protein
VAAINHVKLPTITIINGLSFLTTRDLIFLALGFRLSLIEINHYRWNLSMEYNLDALAFIFRSKRHPSKFYNYFQST